MSFHGVADIRKPQRKADTKNENYGNVFTQGQYHSVSEGVTTNKTAAQTEGKTGVQNPEWNIDTELQNYGDVRTRRIYSEAADVATNKTAAKTEGKAVVHKPEWNAAGIDTRIGNNHPERQHYSEADGDEVKNVTTEEADAEGPTESDEKETARTKKAARVEKEEVEECEGVLSHQRRHFPGSTASNILNAKA